MFTQNGAVESGAEWFSLCGVQLLAHWAVPGVWVRQQAKCILNIHRQPERVFSSYDSTCCSCCIRLQGINRRHQGSGLLHFPIKLLYLAFFSTDWFLQGVLQPISSHNNSVNVPIPSTVAYNSLYRFQTWKLNGEKSSLLFQLNNSHRNPDQEKKFAQCQEQATRTAKTCLSEKKLCHLFLQVCKQNKIVIFLGVRSSL